MNVGLLDVRRSILAALGLLVACGPGMPDDGSGSAESGANDGDDGSSMTAEDGTAEDGTAEDGSGDDGPDPVLCEGSMPILQTGVAGSVPTGWEVCANGVIHRVDTVTCEDTLPSGPSCSLADQSCSTDADCTEGPHGRCVEFNDFIESCSCRYGCETDADCSEGWVCACAGDAAGYPGGTRCVPSECTDDAACADQLCGLGSGDDGCGTSYQGACTTPGDLCTTDDDCPADCYPDNAMGVWTCQDFCCCGRPLLVDGAPVTAAAVTRDDWARGSGPAGQGLPVVVRQRIAEHWVGAAQLEHASVASFARFTLELMAQGAPPSLLAMAQQAGIDEIDHARRCFGLASSLSGAPVGPGPLSVVGAQPATSLEAMVEAVIAEACVGETLAAVEARHAMTHATHPEVRGVLEVIAEDEQRHAELGWQTLRWALSQANATLRARLLDRLDEAIERALADCPPAMVDHDRAWLRAYGVLDPADRRRAHQEAVAQVLRPCAAALRGSVSATARV